MADPERPVLIVDDDEGIRELLSIVLKKEGYAVETAVDEEEGLRKAQALRPALIVLDLMLPRYGGFEVLRALQDGDLGKTPIVVVTGRYTDPSTADLIRQESNVVELLEKPVKTARFIAAVNKVLRPGPVTGGAAEA